MIALARKYRPRRFSDLLVQDHVAAALRGAVVKSRVAHGYLLAGPRGVGKTTAARILAMALNCERGAGESGEPCGECPTCVRISTGGANLDVVEIDAASNRSVDDARDLRERAMYAASQAEGHKVYIIDEAHMLTREAWNALLKVLEEPPPRVVFVFATTEPQKIANTAAPVLSRLQRFDFRRIGPGAIRARLAEVLAAEGLTAEEDALALIARYADGGMRDALSVLDQVLSLADGTITAERVREALGLIGDEAFGEVLAAVAAKDTGAIFPIVDRLANAGADLVEFMGGMADLLRALLQVLTGSQPEGLTAAQREVIAAAKARLTAGDVLRMLSLLTEAEASIRRSANSRLVVETLLLRWTLMDRTVDLEEVLRRRGGAPGAASAGEVSTPRERRPSSAAPSSAMPASSARAPAAPLSGAGAASPGPAWTGPLALEPLVAAWSAITAAARARSPLLGTVVEHLRPVAVEGRLVMLSVRLEEGEGDGHMVEGARRQLPAIAELLTVPGTETPQVRIVDAAGGAARADRPKRLSDKELRSKRLTEIRAQDPALDAAADALDLEIVEDDRSVMDG
jgi:DNA polymerase-3 subunit gamma/tau